ncbi:hypothetical protein [Arthrobacter rhizosphaerae]|uniref:hypothetical protein n=1 Tax=Arthrobacter rhizosphaerae TaxID=2855490 RepID=UPI001FF5F971|nr:hypothetical protein [Arthrobacter rhizosphaerae]
MAEISPGGAGGPLRPQVPPPDGDLSIRGGVGGISFQLSELAAGAGALDVLARTLTSVEAATHNVWQELCNYGNEPRSSGVAALEAVGEGRRAVGVVRQELQDIGSQVRACQREYEAAESQSGQDLRMGMRSFELVAAQGIDTGLTGFMNRETSEALARNVPLTLGLLLGVRPELALAAAAALRPGFKGSGVPSIIRMMAEGGVPDLKPRHVKAVEEETNDMVLDASPAGLLARARSVDAEGLGHIEIIQTVQNGHKAFIVIIPGTQPGAPRGGDNPFDEAGIAEGLGYDSAYTGAAIRAALQQAGATVQDQVVAVGYSQGGVHAMNLSNDKAFLAEYDLKYVLTAGSPVGGITPQPGISSLHLEHRQDWVPGSDGVPSPDTRDRVTVTLTNRVLTPLGEEAGLGPGHRLTNYEAGARAVSISDDPSLIASTAALAGVVGAGGAATATRFRMVRDPQVQPKDGAGRVSAARKERHPGYPYGGR